MRLDLFLKQSRLVPRRTVAQQLCEAGSVRVNDSTAKSSREVRIDDILSIKHNGQIKTVRVLTVPTRTPSKTQAATLYEVMSVETYEEEPFQISILLE